MKRSYEFDTGAASSSSSSSSPVRKRQSVLSNTGGGDVQVSLTSGFEFPAMTGTSQKIHDRASMFQAFFVPLTSSAQIAPFMRLFKASPVCDKVDHAMTAHRFNDREIGLDRGYDDDGERFSGKKLSDVVESMDVYGLLVCIREFGGIMLGPIRFQHMTQCARDAIMSYKHLRSLDTQAIEKTKRLLNARDKTIDTLRSMINLPQNSDEVSLSQASASSLSLSLPPFSSSQQNNPKRYDTQNLPTLQRLLNARDLTIKSLRTKLQPSQSDA